MAQKLLSVSRQQDRIRGILIEKKGGGYFAGDPMDLSSKEALNSACDAAGEIYINDSFLSAIYVWSLFPRVAPKHIANLLLQDAIEKFQSSGKPNIGFQTIAEVQTDGVRQREIAYVAMEEEEIANLWVLFKKFAKKIKGITSLPVAIAGTVAKFEALESNFAVAWIGETESSITVASKDGIVKVARSFPFGTKGMDPTDQDSAKAFSHRVDKELNRTINFFKQEFREPEPDKIYIFGNRHLESIFETTPLSVLGAEFYFQFKAPLISNYSPEDESETFHIFSSLFLNHHFNFLPRKVVEDRMVKRVLYPSCAVLGIAILALFFWSSQLTAQVDRENIKLQERFTTAMQLKGEVERLEEKINKLEPFQGWKAFYDDTFNDRLAWDRIFSEFGRQIPSNIVLDSLSINPGGKGNWLANISGKVRAPDWEAGLDHIREYGAKIDSSQFFVVKTVNYSPQNLEERAKYFNFNLLLELNKMEQ